MTIEEARQVFLSRGYVEVEGGIIYDPDKWRESCSVISEWLEQEPCNDAISRWSALELVADYNLSMGQVVKGIHALPPVKPEPKWVPVSERMPEDGQSVLFCDIDDDIMIGYHIKGRPNTHFSQNGTYDDIKNVKKWMPLPETYEAERGGKR